MYPTHEELFKTDPKILSEKYKVHLRTIYKWRAKHGDQHGRDVSKFVPDGYAVKGVSSLVDKAGGIVMQWVKTDQDKVRQFEIMQEAIKSLCENIPQLEPVSGPSYSIKPLLNLYTISDFHLGMMACAEESGADFDIKIAEELFNNWFSHALKHAPDAHTGVVSILGDFLHYDGLKPVTPAHGHVLDADTRYFKMINVAMRIMRRAIDMCLKKHQVVKIVITSGNHDLSSSLWLQTALNAMYECEPRVQVDMSPDVFKMVRHGETMLCFHHGHSVRFDKIESTMIARFRKDFGETKYAYSHVGHLHHQKIIESSNFVVEQHRTLAAKDAYAANGGWFSGRSANVITYHSEYGEVSRLTISPEILKPL